MRKATKKIFAMSMASAMAMSMLAGCTSNEDSGKTTDNTKAEGTNATETKGETKEETKEFVDYSKGFEETVTIEIPVYERGWEGWDPTDNFWSKWIQENMLEKYNIQVNFTKIGRSTEVTDFTQMLAGGTAPDIIFHFDYPNIVDYNNEDAFQEIDLDEVAYYAPTFWENMGDRIKEYGVIDGKQVVVMGDRSELLSNNWGTIVRKDWVEQVGWKVEDIQTLEDWEEVLGLWKEAGLGYASSSLVMKSFNFDYSFREWPNNEEERALNSDLAVASLSWEPTKEWLRAQNRQYNAGLITPEFYLDKDGTNARADFLSGKAGTLAMYINKGTKEQVIDPLLQAFPEAELAILPLGSGAPEDNQAQGRKYWPFGMIFGINADTSDEERIACWLYVEWMNQYDTVFTLQNGFEGTHYELNEDGVPVPLGYTGEEKLSPNDNGDYTWVCDANKVYDTEELAKKAAVVSYAPVGYEYLIEDIIASNEANDEYYTTDYGFTVPLESLNEYKADLATLWQESYVELVRCNPDEFDALYEEKAQEYLDAGYQEILDEKKEAYDAGNYFK